MNKIINLLEEKLMPLANKIASNNILNAIRHSMMGMAPFFIIGSLFLLAAYFPSEGYTNFINGIFGENVFQNLVTSVSDATINMMGFIVLIAVAYNYAKIKETDDIYVVISSLMAFLIVTPIVDGSLSTEWLGAKGMFISIIIAILVTNLYIFTKKLGLAPKMPDSVPPAVIKSFGALFPIAVIALVALIIKAIFAQTPYGDIHNFVFVIVQAPLLKMGNNVISLIVSEIIGQFLWFFGLHGNDIVGSVMRPIWLTQTAANLEAFKAGLEIPNIITEQMRNVYMLMGGSGSTLPLVLSLIFLTKSKHLKALALLALPASLFNINEPVIFGLPIVLNLTLFIPWMITTPIMGMITYFLMSIGVVNLTNGIMIPWTTPVLFSGYLVSGISGLLLQLLLMAVGFAIYYPFIKALDRKLCKEELEREETKNDDLDLEEFEF